MEVIFINPAQIARSITEFFSYFWRRRGSLRSLVAFLIFLNIVLAVLVWPVYVVLLNAKVITELDALVQFILAVLSAFALCNLLLMGIWFVWRLLPSVPPFRIGVFFAPYAEPECEDIIHSLYKEFQGNLAARNLSKLVTQSLIPYNYEIKSHEEAHRFLMDTGGRLLIYGQVQRGKIKGEAIEGFKNISFTVRHRGLNREEILPVAKTLAGALALRSFAFSDANSFLEKTLVIQNITEVACFFLAVALTLDGKVSDAIPILEELLATVKRGIGGQA